MDVRLAPREEQSKKGLIRRELAVFWAWYERHYLVNLSVATCLFLLQLVHLAWLSLDVLATRLLGESYFPVDGAWLGVLLVVDYLEVPALISVSLVYINELRQGRNGRTLLYLLMLNSQWIHITWISDEFVVSRLAGTGRAWPAWLAYVAIAIDYLELPVMADTTRRLVRGLAGKEELRDVLKEERAERRRRRLGVTTVYCPGLALARGTGDADAGVIESDAGDPMCCDSAS